MSYATLNISCPSMHALAPDDALHHRLAPQRLHNQRTQHTPFSTAPLPNATARCSLTDYRICEHHSHHRSAHRHA